MATGEVRRRGFTLLEMMAVVAIFGILVAMSANAISEARRVSRVSGMARLVMQRLQTARTRAVSQGNAEGYYIGPNGPGAAGVDANRAYFYVKALATVTSPGVSYVAGTDVPDRFRDVVDNTNNVSVVTITGPGAGLPSPLDVGFDMNGLPSVTPPPGGPNPGWYCILVADGQVTTLRRWVILFNDGTVKVQGNETYCGP